MNRDYRIVWLKSTGTFKEQTRLPLKLSIEKSWCRQKKTKKQFFQILIHAEMKATKRGIMQQKTSKINPFMVKSVLESKCKGSRRRCNTRKIQPKTWTTIKKKLNPITNANHFTNTRKKKSSVSIFLHLCMSNIWAPGPRFVCISKNLFFSLVFFGKKHNSSTSRDTNQQVHY